MSGYRDPEQYVPGKLGGVIDSMFETVERAEQNAVVNQPPEPETEAEQPKSAARLASLYTPIFGGYPVIYQQCKDILKREGRIR